jgi:hypothetical protein
VAGSSVTKALGPFSDQNRCKTNALERLLIRGSILPKHYPARYPWHITAVELKKHLKKSFDAYFKFGFSRDPWDWQVSLYTFMLKNPAHKQHALIKSMKGFDEYIDWRINKDMELQMKAFYDENDNCLMDFVGKIESIEEDFRYICKRIGVEASISHVNKSRVNNDYLGYYDSKLIDYVYEAFYPDIKVFNYSKPSLGAVAGGDDLN